MTNPLFTLTEVSAQLRLDAEVKDPEGWLVRQILSKRIKARKIGRAWLMTQSDIDYAIEAFANPVRRRPTEVKHIGLSAGSQARRSA